MDASSSSSSDYGSAGSDDEEATSASNRGLDQETADHACVNEGPQNDLDLGREAASLTMPDQDQPSDAELLQRADELKVEGNRLYGEGKFVEAAAKYNEAIATG